MKLSREDDPESETDEGNACLKPVHPNGSNLTAKVGEELASGSEAKIGAKGEGDYCGIHSYFFNVSIYSKTAATSSLGRCPVGGIISISSSVVNR